MTAHPQLLIELTRTEQDELGRQSRRAGAVRTQRAAGPAPTRLPLAMLRTVRQLGSWQQ